MSPMSPKHVIAVVGGATAGAEAAALLAERGVTAVVFEQNPRPYGKIEDGLPRWHDKLRLKEYQTINANLDRPGIHFVPCTRIGRDVDFTELVRSWGFTAVILAHGAWRDRELPVEGAEAFVGRGLIYQNPFIYWFNHFTEKGYDGPRYEIGDGGLVVGGGLASIDVIKVLQLESTRAALAGRGIEVDTLHLEHAGIPATLEKHGLAWADLGLRPATLLYRRRIEDMPLSEMPEGADEEKQRKAESVRRRILEKAMQKYCFEVKPQRLPLSLLVEGDRLVGLRCQETRVENGRAVPIQGAIEELRAPLVVSSIGSIPEPMKGIEQDGALYRYADLSIGRLQGYDSVFSVGNVVTGKGNINASRRHSIEVSEKLISSFLGLGAGDHAQEDQLWEPVLEAADRAAERVADFVGRQPLLPPAEVDALLARVRERQLAVGYDGNYGDWIRRVTPQSAA